VTVLNALQLANRRSTPEQSTRHKPCVHPRCCLHTGNRTWAAVHINSKHSTTDPKSATSAFAMMLSLYSGKLCCNEFPNCISQTTDYFQLLQLGIITQQKVILQLNIVLQFIGKSIFWWLELQICLNSHLLLFWVGWGSKFAFSHKLWRSSLQHSQYRVRCDY